MDLTRLLCGIYQILVSALGLGINGYVFLMLRNPRYNGAFHYFCSFKSICNILVLLASFLWSGPCTLLNRLFLPQFYNIFAGQINCMLFFGMGPSISFCMTVNRFLAAFYPLKFRNSRGRSIKLVGIAFCLITILPLALNGIISDNCAYYYDLATLSWSTFSDCANNNNYMLLYVIEILTATSTIINVLTFLKIMSIMRLISNDSTSLLREKMNRRMLIQNVVQDMLYVVDMLAGIYALAWSPAIWWQFFVNTGIWQAHLTLDGFVMYWYSKPKEPSRNPTIVINPSSC